MGDPDRDIEAFMHPSIDWVQEPEYVRAFRELTGEEPMGHEAAFTAPTGAGYPPFINVDTGQEIMLRLGVAQFESGFSATTPWFAVVPGEVWQVRVNSSNANEVTGPGSFGGPSFMSIEEVGEAGDLISPAAPSSGGGGSIIDKIMIARAIAYTPTYGPDDTIDKLVESNGLRGLLFDAFVAGTTPVESEVATLTVPTGKVAVLLYAHSNTNGSGGVGQSATFYNHRLRNTTTSTDFDPNTNLTVSTDGMVDPDAAITASPYPNRVGVAGDVLVCRAWSNADAIYRGVSGFYVIALVDAATGEIVL